MKTIPKSHLFTESDLTLFDLNQIYQISTIWFEKGMKDYVGTFDLFVRDLPEKRNFLLFGGLEEIVCGIQKWHYSKSQVKFLLKNKMISKGFAKYLEDFKFTCDVMAMPEGTAFFPNEPVLRITGPLIQVNLLTMFLLNSLVSNTIFMSKFIRIVLAAEDKAVLSSVIRGHSFESAMKAARAEYITGIKILSCPGFYKKYHLPVPVKPPFNTLYHAYIQSFEDEYTAMEYGEDVFPGRTMAMIDTFNYKTGLDSAIKLGKKLKSEGKHLNGIVIDSGDLAKIAVFTRKKLDRAGLKDTKITLASNLDEYEISKLNKLKVPADSFIAVTEAVTSADAPKLEAVFKLAEVDDGNKIRPTIKLAKGKMSLPGKKQVFRKSGEFFSSDIIDLENGKFGNPLLVSVFKNGELIYKLPSLPEIKSYVENQVKHLPSDLLSVNEKAQYNVVVSDQIKHIVTNFILALRK